MPAMDKTGPMGKGPMGRGRGGCQSEDKATPHGRGRGGCRQNKGRGNGRGRCCRMNDDRGQETLSREEEIAVLEKQISDAQARLDSLVAAR